METQFRGVPVTLTALATGKGREVIVDLTALAI